MSVQAARPGNCKDRQKKRCPSHPGSACKVDMIRPAVHPHSRFIQKPELVASDTEDMRPLRPHRPLPGCAQPTQQAPWILNQDAHDAQMDTVRKFLGCKPAKCNPNLIDFLSHRKQTRCNPWICGWLISGCL